MFGRVVTLARGLAGGGLFCALASQAAALEYCVTCQGPPALYRCVVEGTPDGPGHDSSASLSCISQMATKGRHETCGVSRGAPFPCPGLTAVITQSAVNHAAPAPATATPDPQTGPAETHPAEPAEQPAEPAGVPRTVEELAGQTVKSSKEGLEKAGEAIGGTAKKAGEQIGNAGSAIGSAATQTWTCITSLFSSCSPAPEQAPAPENTPANNPPAN